MKEVVTTVKLLHENLEVKCPEEQVEQLQRAADALNEHLKKYQGNDTIADYKKLFAITSLNLMHQLLSLESNEQSFHQRVQSLHERISVALCD
ncbi:MAG: cell division protein ZapA [Gammaproteobacteria bacterium]